MYAQVLRGSYKSLFQFNLERITPRQLADAIGSLGVTGETAKKAQAFFIKAAEYAEIPLSAHVKGRRASASGATNGGNGQAGAARKKKRPARPAAAGEAKTEVDPLESEGESWSIKLKNGQALRLSLDGKSFALDREDRAFAFGLLDQMQDYQARIGSQEDAEEEEESEDE